MNKPQLTFENNTQKCVDLQTLTKVKSLDINYDNLQIISDICHMQQQHSSIYFWYSRKKHWRRFSEFPKFSAIFFQI